MERLIFQIILILLDKIC